MSTTAAIVVAFLGSGVLSALIGAWASRRAMSAQVDQLDADTESKEVQTAHSVVDLVTTQMEAQRRELADVKQKVTDLETRLNESDLDRGRLHTHIDRLHVHIDRLEALMREHGIDPPARPNLQGGKL